MIPATVCMSSLHVRQEFVEIIQPNEHHSYCQCCQKVLYAPVTTTQRRLLLHCEYHESPRASMSSYLHSSRMIHRPMSSYYNQRKLSRGHGIVFVTSLS